MEAEDREARRVRERESSWASGKSLYDQMHELAYHLGPETLRDTVNYLRVGLQDLCDGWAQRAAASARLGLQARSYRIQNNGEVANNFLQNSNRGRTGNRGGRARRRGAMEGRGTMRRYHTQQTDTRLQLRQGSSNGEQQSQSQNRQQQSSQQ